jgi:hypothetical protein
LEETSGMKRHLIFASFDGRLSKDGQEISGQWKQGPVSLPLVFKKG